MPNGCRTMVDVKLSERGEEYPLIEISGFAPARVMI